MRRVEPNLLEVEVECGAFEVFLRWLVESGLLPGTVLSPHPIDACVFSCPRCGRELTAYSNAAAAAGVLQIRRRRQRDATLPARPPCDLCRDY